MPVLSRCAGALYYGKKEIIFSVNTAVAQYPPHGQTSTLRTEKINCRSVKYYKYILQKLENGVYNKI